jgi:hypothetical protein
MASHRHPHYTVSAFLFGLLEREPEQVGRWAGPRAGLDVTVKRTILTSADAVILRQRINFIMAVPAAIHPVRVYTPEHFVRSTHGSFHFIKGDVIKACFHFEIYYQ